MYNAYIHGVSEDDSLNYYDSTQYSNHEEEDDEANYNWNQRITKIVVHYPCENEKNHRNSYYPY